MEPPQMIQDSQKRYYFETNWVMQVKKLTHTFDEINLYPVSSTHNNKQKLPTNKRLLEPYVHQGWDLIRSVRKVYIFSNLLFDFLLHLGSQK